MADSDGAAVRVQARIVKGDAQLLGAAQNLRGEGFVDFDNIHVIQRQAGAAQGFLAGFNRAQAHDARGDTGDSTGEDARARLDAVLLADGFAADDQRSRAVVDAGGVAGGDHATFKQWTQTGQGGQVAARTRVFVLIDHLGRLLAALRDFNRVDFFSEEAVGTGLFVQRLAACGVSVGFFAGDTQVGSNVVGGLRHGVIAELLLDLGVREARTDGAVEGAEVAAVGTFALGDNERRAAHAFNATGDEQLAFTGFDRTSGVEDGRQARAAQTVDGNTGHFLRQAGHQAGVASNVARVFTGLVGVAHDNVFVVVAFEGVTRNDSANDFGQQVIRTDAGDGAGVAAEGGTQTIIDVGSHGITPESRGRSAAGRVERGDAARGWGGSVARRKRPEYC